MLALLATLLIQAPESPAFSFREVTTGLTRESAVATRLVERCSNATLADRPVIECSGARKLSEPGISGFEHYGLFLSFDQVGLVAFQTAVLQTGLTPIRSAFTQKFGEPCDRVEKTLTNAFGGSVQQVTDVWCLSDGRLSLASHAPINFERARIEFIGARFLATPVPPGRVDF